MLKKILNSLIILSLLTPVTASAYTASDLSTLLKTLSEALHSIELQISGLSQTAAVGVPNTSSVGNVLLSSNRLDPLYAVREVGSSVHAVAYKQDGVFVSAVAQDGSVIWKKEFGAGTLFGGFDFDSDGWVDLGLVQWKATSGTCGGQQLGESWITFFKGKTGDTVPGTPHIADQCWSFPAATYPGRQWVSASVLYGDGPVLAVQPGYASQGTFYEYDAKSSTFKKDNTYVFPSSSAFTATYSKATSYLADSHIANGLLTKVGAEQRLIFFTSRRLVQYKVGPLGPSQLVAEYPFLQRSDLVGRNYGLVAIDPNYPTNLALMSGTDTYTMYQDMLAGSAVTDPWAGIERHITVYNMEKNALQDRFYSYAHDNNDGNKYEGRISYPQHYYVKTAAGSPSRLAYSVYEAGRWNLHVSVPGGTADATVIPYTFLWDIIDIDGDGTDEFITSSASNGYIPSWETDISHWDSSDLTLVGLVNFGGSIPALTWSFQDPTRSQYSGYGALYTTSSAGRNIVLRTKNGALEERPYKTPTLTTGTPALTLDSAQYSAGDTILVSWINGRTKHRKDWITFVPKGTSAAKGVWSSATPWMYTGGASQGIRLSLKAPSVVGAYEVVYLADDGYQEVARSAPFIIGAARPAALSIKSDQMAYAPEATIAVTWHTNGSTNAKDWVGLVKADGKWTDFGGSRAKMWFYTEGLKTGTKKLSAPNVAGRYQLVYFSNDGYEEVTRSEYLSVGAVTKDVSSATSQGGVSTVPAKTVSCVPDPASPQTQTVACASGQTGLVVQVRESVCAAGATTPVWGLWSTTSNNCATPVAPGSLSTSVKTVSVAGAISVSWSKSGPTPKDWIALVASGQKWVTGNPWVYTGGGVTGTKTLIAPTVAGTYDVVYMTNDATEVSIRVSGVQVTPLASITLAAANAQREAGTQVSISWNNPGTVMPKDWVALVPTGQKWSSEYPWFYTDGAVSGTKVILVPKAPGMYDIVYFSNDSQTEVFRTPGKVQVM